jgi:hypothetical protein
VSAVRASFAVTLAAALVLGTAGTAVPQSLGDAAKKEQERREKLKQGGSSTRTVTEQELAATKGTLANDPNQRAAKGPEAGGDKKDARSRKAEKSSTEPPQEPAQGEEYWRRRVAEARARLADAQRRHEAFERMVQLGQPAQFDENGRRVIYSAQQLKAMADAATAELKAAEDAMAEVLEEGRRAGALPGWLR